MPRLPHLLGLLFLPAAAALSAHAITWREAQRQPDAWFHTVEARQVIANVILYQYPSGGWPMFFPLRPGYCTRITFNDDAMASVLALLHDTARGQPPFAFVDAVHRRRAAQAVERGVRCILATQIIVEGQRTAWCAQHDEHTLAPAKARSYELP